jgi:hypothetical protein
MRLPDLTDKVKDVPVRALRAVFAGVGQLLTAAEQMLGADPGSDSGNPAEAGPRSETADRPARRSLDSTGNVRLLTPEDLPAPAEAGAATPEARAATPEAGTATPEAGTATPEAGAGPPAEAGPAPVEAGPAPAEAGKAAASLPVPGYDGLSIASLRARLRTLDVDQLSMLIQYEKKNAGRDEVVAMFERRIAKLGSGAD